MLFNNAILNLILQRTMPLTVGVFAIILVQLVDSIFIGRLGIDALTVQGITQPFGTVIIGIQVGIGVAATCIMSVANGAKETGKSKAIASISLVFGTLFITLMCLGFWLFQDTVFNTFIPREQSTAERYTTFTQYWPAWLASSVIGATLYLISAIFRAHEDSKTPGFVLILASMINLILDPILMFVLGWGMIGAAIASAIAFFVCCIYLLYKAYPHHWLERLHFTKANIHYFALLVRMAIPTSANQILPAVSALFAMLIISRAGDDSIAFWNLLLRTESFVLVFSLSLTMSIPPIVGRYLGEGNTDKIKTVATTTARCLLVTHIIIALCVAFTSDGFAAMMTTDTSIVSNMSFALCIIPFSYGPLGLCMVVVSIFTQKSKPQLIKA